MGSLQKGDELLLDNGQTAIVEKLTLEKAPAGRAFTTYNFEVEDFHTYFVAPAPSTSEASKKSSTDHRSQFSDNCPSFVAPKNSPPSELAVWVHNKGKKCNIPGDGDSYDYLTSQSLYILFNKRGGIKYVGIGDHAARFAKHAVTKGKKNLDARVVFKFNLSKARARGLEQRLINHFGGAVSQNNGKVNQLINKIRSYAYGNKSALDYQEAATDELFEEALNRIQGIIKYD